MTTQSLSLALLLVTFAFCGYGVRGKYSLEIANTALDFCKVSYCDLERITAWACPSCGRNQSTVRMINVTLAKEMDIQAVTAVYGSRIIVAFRGSNGLTNWLHNLDAIFTPLSIGNCNGCAVHRGFQKGYSAVRGDLLIELRGLLKSNPNHSLLVTGHSLGGALAVFLAAELASWNDWPGTKPRIDLYTFGAPRVGDENFVRWMTNAFHARGDESYRIVHRRDVVSHIPPMFVGYVHASTEIWYSTGGNKGYKTCNDVSLNNPSFTPLEDDTCSNSLWWPISVNDHLLYLGRCSSCTCGKGVLSRVAKTADLEVPENILHWIAADMDYLRTHNASKI